MALSDALSGLLKEGMDNTVGNFSYSLTEKITAKIKGQWALSIIINIKIKKIYTHMRKLFLSVQNHPHILLATALFMGMFTFTGQQMTVRAENTYLYVETKDVPQVSDEEKAANMQKVQAFLKECKTFYIATAEGDQPRVRPFGVSEIINGRLYIITAKVKQVFKQISKNGKFEICALKPTGVEWVRISGTLVNDDSRSVKETFLERNPSLKGMYSADDDNMAVLYISNGVASFSSFAGASSQISF